MDKSTLAILRRRMTKTTMMKRNMMKTGKVHRKHLGGLPLKGQLKGTSWKHLSMTSLLVTINTTNFRQHTTWQVCNNSISSKYSSWHTKGRLTTLRRKVTTGSTLASLETLSTWLTGKETTPKENSMTYTGSRELPLITFKMIWTKLKRTQNTTTMKLRRKRHSSQKKIMRRKLNHSLIM